MTATPPAPRPEFRPFAPRTPSCFVPREPAVVTISLTPGGYRGWTRDSVKITVGGEEIGPAPERDAITPLAAATLRCAQFAIDIELGDFDFEDDEEA